MSNMKKHFVTFYSPGTFFAEITVREIESWDVPTAVKMAKTITERYGAKPYAFSFSTRSRGPRDLDSKISKKSGRYYLGGKVETLAEIEARNLDSERILRDNMRCNGWDKIITGKKGWHWSQPFEKGDVVL